MVRLFLAIELPDEVRSHLIEVRKALESVLPKVAYTRAENLHLTLKFLGEVEPKRLDAITESLGKISTTRIELVGQALECFPNRGSIRIVAASMGGTLAPLGALHQAIEQRCQHLGFEREQRVYRPHATLARARPVLSPKFRQVALDATASCWPGPAFAPGEFVLMNSELSPQGSKYSTVARFPIG